MTKAARPTFGQARRLVAELVDRYSRNRENLIRPASNYSETDVRTQYIDPLLEALGWDVRNQANATPSTMEVVTERQVERKLGRGRPDYLLRIAGYDVLPIEAKRPSVDIEADAKAANQARSYGWSLSLPASVITNFERFHIFDTMDEPPLIADSRYGLIPSCAFTYNDFVDRFDELWHRVSYESIADKGIFDIYGHNRPDIGASDFDKAFLGDFRRWRLKLAINISANNPKLREAEVGSRTQRLLNALLFIRVSEERGYTGFRQLLESANSANLGVLFSRMDLKYNSGLFNLLEKTTVDSELLASIATELYWPNSPYAFGVLDSLTLSSVYEQYLGERVVFDDANQVTLEEKPEIEHAGGVTSTPSFVSKFIVKKTLGPLIEKAGPDITLLPTVLDPAAGSGVFLVEAFRQIVEHLENAGVEVTFSVRRRIVNQCLFGIDIDPAAVEVCRLSLALEALGTLRGDEAGDPTLTLPDLSTNVINGNSIIGEDFYEMFPELAADVDTLENVRPLSIHDELNNIAARPFDAIIGNPPYIRIQELSRHWPEQLEYFQHPNCGLLTGQSGNFDVYQLFVERSLSLLSKNGRLGFILPNRFTAAPTAAVMRSNLGPRLELLVHFGELQLFPGRTIYSSIVIAGPKMKRPAILELVEELDTWKSHPLANTIDLERTELTGAPWPIASEDQKCLLSQLEKSRVARLGDVGWVNIFVGVQTSADDYYFVKPISSSKGTTRFIDLHGIETEIESGILRPALQDQVIGYYGGQPVADRQLIFPYQMDANGRMRVMDHDTMLRRYPLALKYFLRHRKHLEGGRSVSPDPGENFWAFGRSQSLSKMAMEKLIVRVLSLKPLYALDSQGLFVPGGGDGGPYYLLRPSDACPYSIDVLQAIVSYLPVDLYVTVNGKKFRGSYASHRKQFLSDIPVPELDRSQQRSLESFIRELRNIEVELRAELDSSRKSVLSRRRSNLVRQCAAILDVAYGVDPELRAKVVGV